MNPDRSYKFQPIQDVGAAEHQSLWLREAFAGERISDDLERLEGQQTADVCIVGGGYTGLWTAIRLAEYEPTLDIVVIEARLCGSGASGRNGGIVVGWWWKLPTLLKALGPAEARELLAASLQGIDDVEAICRAHNIDAGFSREGWYWTATNPAQLGAWRATVDAAQAIGIDALAELEADTLDEELGSPVHLGGVADPTAAIVQPAILARGLRRVAREAGVRIFERSAVREIQVGRRVSVQTGKGTVEAGTVVLGLNAWMADLPAFRSSVFTVSSDCIATAPIPERLQEIGWSGSKSWSDSSIRVRYARTTPDGRIVYGRGGGTLAYRSRVTRPLEYSPKQRAELERDFQRLFSHLGEVPISDSWAGAVERSVVGLPTFGRLDGDPRLLYAIGYSGTGIAPSAVGGRVLASLALDRNDRWTAVGVGLSELRRFGLPPEPVRYAGGRVVQLGVERKERAEDERRRPARLDVVLASFVPSPTSMAPSLQGTITTQRRVGWLPGALRKLPFRKVRKR